MAFDKEDEKHKCRIEPLQAGVKYRFLDLSWHIYYTLQDLNVDGMTKLCDEVVFKVFGFDMDTLDNDNVNLESNKVILTEEHINQINKEIAILALRK